MFIAPHASNRTNAVPFLLACLFLVFIVPVGLLYDLQIMDFASASIVFFSIVLLVLVIAAGIEKEMFVFRSLADLNTRTLSIQLSIIGVSILLGCSAMFVCCQAVCWGDGYSKTCDLVFPRLSSAVMPDAALCLNMLVGCLVASISALLMQALFHCKEMRIAFFGALISPGVIFGALATFAFSLWVELFSYLVLLIDLAPHISLYDVESLYLASYKLIAFSTIPVTFAALSVALGCWMKKTGHWFKLLQIIASMTVLVLFFFFIKPAGFLHVKSSCNHVLGRYSLALKEAIAAIDCEPDNGALYYSRALIYLALSQREQAASDFRAASSLSFANQMRPSWTGSFYQITGKLYKPLFFADKTASDTAQPNSSLLKLARLRWWHSCGNSDRIAKLRSVARIPYGAEYYCDRACSYNQSDRFRDAEREAHNALKVYPYGFRANLILSKAHYLVGDYRKAVDDSTIVIGLVLHDFSYYDRAKAYLALEQYEEALSDFNHYIQKNRYDSDAYYCRAQCYQKLGRDDLAELDLKRCNQLKENNRNGLRLRGIPR